MSQRKNETREEFLERIRKERRDRWAADPEFRRRAAEDRKRYHATAEGKAARRAQWAQRMARPGVRERDRIIRRARMHSISVDRLLDLMAGGCGICGVLTCKNGNSLHIDHDHWCCPGEYSCGKCVRGALCYVHNVWFEHFLDSPRVIAYLERTDAGQATLKRIDYSTLLVLQKGTVTA